MIKLPTKLAFIVSLLLAFMATPAALAEFIEPPILADSVAAGELPPVSERLPQVPRLIDMKKLGRISGQYGGTLHLLMGRVKDMSMMTVYGYARLVGFDANGELQPDILQSYDVVDGRIFTLHIRPGHKWSDGYLFTSEDIRYAWEDVINNDELSPGPPREMLIEGKPPKFTVIDALTVRFEWDSPNPEFLPSLAGARPLFLAMPAHYLKQFHGKYQDKDKLAALVKQAKVKAWRNLHMRNARQYRPENPDLPSLEPWLNTTRLPSEHLIFKRNPYFHRIDAEGHQLPYIDRVEINITSPQLIAAKTGTGDSDLQGRYLRFDDYTFLKAGEKRNNYKVRLWKSGTGASVALFPNLNVADPVLRQIFRDVKVRRALSLAINREEINKILYFGLAHESGNTVVPESSLYLPELSRMWSKFDPVKANELLDSAGLAKRDKRGIRLRPDGKPLELIVETAGENTLQTDMLELIRDYWLAVGIKIYPRSSQRDVLYSRALSGLAEVTVWSGFDNGAANADLSPIEIAPGSQYQLEWPKWGLSVESSGVKGEPADLPKVQELSQLLHNWRQATNKMARKKIWHQMLKIYANQVFSIGILNSTLQPLVVSNRLHNVPEVGVWAFSPSAFVGIYMPDSFWFNPQDDKTEPAQ